MSITNELFYTISDIALAIMVFANYVKLTRKINTVTDEIHFHRERLIELKKEVLSDADITLLLRNKVDKLVNELALVKQKMKSNVNVVQSDDTSANKANTEAIIQNKRNRKK